MSNSPDSSKKIIVSAGQTGGHIYPAIAVADELSSRGYEVIFAGVPGHMEQEIAASHGYEFLALEASGFNRKKPKTLITGIATIARSTLAARKYIKENNVRAVVTFGGYACLPAGIAAKGGKAKLIIHEQNSYPGIANKFLAKRADAICLTYKDSASYLDIDIDDGDADPHSSSRTVSLTGNPVRKEVLSADKQANRERLGYGGDDIVVLAFGGSQGAKTINEAMSGHAKEILSASENVKVVHVAGKSRYEDTLARLELDEDDSSRYKLVDYAEDLPAYISAADIVISRAGASTLSELSVLTKPAILVPFPRATDDHQTKNARSIEKIGGAIVVSDIEAQEGMLVEKLIELISSKDMRDEMERALNGVRVEKDAAVAIADIVESSI